MQAILKYSIQLTDLDVRFPLVLPLNAMDVAMRVLCRYQPEDSPPPPTIVIVTVVEVPNPEPALFTIRNFMLVSESEPLPADFTKYIATVPFGSDKTSVYLIETHAITPVAAADLPAKVVEAAQHPAKVIE